MIAGILAVGPVGGSSGGFVPDFAMIARGELGDWGELIVFAVVVVASGLNGLIQAAKKKRQAKERERGMPAPNMVPPPVAKPARARPRSADRATGQIREPIPLRPKPRPPRPSPVSTSPPTAEVPRIFETLAEAIREANAEEPHSRHRRKSSDTSRVPARQAGTATRPPDKSRQSVADRHEIEDRERRQGEVSHQRIGHVKQGVVAPLADAYATKGVGASALQGVDLRRAVVLREILGPPVALRDSDDYFSP